MRARLFLVCLVLLVLQGMAQDLDFSDFRNKKDNFSKISDKDVRADVASFALAGVDESIGKAPLPSLPVLDVGPNFIKYGDDKIQVSCLANAPTGYFPEFRVIDDGNSSAGVANHR